MDQIKEKPAERRKILPAIETAAFCRQTAMILKSGIFLYDGMEVLCRSYKDTPYGLAFEAILAGVRDGGTLYEGVCNAGVFPNYMVQMVRAGEMTGNLDAVLERLADYYEKEDRLRATVRNAVAYPLVLVAMLAVVIGILVVKVLPVFSQVFRSLGVGEGGASGTALALGVGVGKAMLVIVALLFVAVIVIALMWKLGGRQKMLSMAERISPRIKKLMKKQSAQRFAQVTSMVLASGYSLEKGLEMLPELLDDDRIKQKIDRCRELLNESGDFSAAIEKIDLFEPLHERMLRVGTETGHTDQVLASLADQHDQEVTEEIEAIAANIEPILVAVLTVVIGGILLAVMLPLAGILTTLG